MDETPSCLLISSTTCDIQSLLQCLPKFNKLIRFKCLLLHCYLVVHIFSSDKQLWVGYVGTFVRSELKCVLHACLSSDIWSDYFLWCAFRVVCLHVSQNTRFYKLILIIIIVETKPIPQLWQQEQFAERESKQWKCKYNDNVRHPVHIVERHGGGTSIANGCLA